MSLTGCSQIALKERQGQAGMQLPQKTGKPTYLQQRWNVLSGLPSDSDFTWTISHTELVSASRGKTKQNIVSTFTCNAKALTPRSVKATASSPARLQLWEHYPAVAALSSCGSITCTGQGPHLQRLQRDHVAKPERIPVLINGGSV